MKCSITFFVIVPKVLRVEEVR